MSGGCGSPTQAEAFADLKAQLSPHQFQVTQAKVTERPFSNKYNRHWERGSYHCVVCNTKIFESNTKFESNSGWPAFSDVVDTSRIDLKPDLSHVGANLLLLVSRPDLARTEVSCSNCNAHLGHLFKDGPKPSGLRYCVNSASLNFQPHQTEDEADSSSVNNVPSETENNSSITPISNKTSIPGQCGSGKMCFFPVNSNTNNGISPAAAPTASCINSAAKSKQQWLVEKVSSRPTGGILRETSL